MAYYRTKGDGKKTVIAVLVILLVIAAVYVGYNFYMNYQYQQQIAALQEGAGLGYEQAVVDLINQASECNVVPVTYNNVTLNMVAVECLQVPQMQQSAQ